MNFSHSKVAASVGNGNDAFLSTNRHISHLDIAIALVVRIGPLTDERRGNRRTGSYEDDSLLAGPHRRAPAKQDSHSKTISQRLSHFLAMLTSRLRSVKYHGRDRAAR